MELVCNTLFDCLIKFTSIKCIAYVTGRLTSKTYCKNWHCNKTPIHRSETVLWRLNKRIVANVSLIYIFREYVYIFPITVKLYFWTNCQINIYPTIATHKYPKNISLCDEGISMKYIESTTCTLYLYWSFISTMTWSQSIT